MKLLLIYISCLVFLLDIHVVWSQAEYNEVKAKIDIDKSENMLSVSGTAENLKSEFKNISFKLSVLKKNKSNSNKSDNAQDGRVTLEPLQKVVLSKTQINLGSEDQVIILLLIYDENRAIIGKDRIELGNEDKVEIDISQHKDGLEMGGIISNDTKTKLGNDFYDFFYYEFSNLKVKSNKIVSIQEELTFGRTTKILVNVDGEIIDEFITRPEEDYLKYMAITSSAKVFKYFKNIEKQDKEITQY